MRKLFFILLFCLCSHLLLSCDMFALLLKEDSEFSEFPALVNEYFDFLASRSSSSTNNDGYGIIAFRTNNENITEEDKWYKTGIQTWYEGNLPEEPLELARTALLQPDSGYYLIIGHARNATGGEGSHPFTQDTPDGSYSFCHNGVISNQLLQSFMEYLGQSWFAQYPSNWYGEYGEIHSFIDSELFFSYLLHEIIACDFDVNAGISEALQSNKPSGISIADKILTGQNAANFILAKKDSLFVFRNNVSSSFRLSWEEQENYFAVKTQDQLLNNMQQNELISLSRQGDVRSQVLELTPEEEFIPAAPFYAYPNPASHNVFITFQKTRDDDNSNDDYSQPDMIHIYNLKGQKVRSIPSWSNNSTQNSYYWDGRNKSGKPSPSGVYFISHLPSGKRTQVILFRG